MTENSHPVHCQKCTIQMICPSCIAQETGKGWDTLTLREKLQLFGKLIEDAELRKRGLGQGGMLHVGHSHQVHVLNVGVMVNTTSDHSGKSELPQTPGAVAAAGGEASASASAHVKIEAASQVTVQAVSIPIHLEVTQAELQHITDTAVIKQAVENAIIARVLYGSEPVRKFRQKNREEKQRGATSKTWFDRQIKHKERELSERMDAAKQEIKNMKKVTQRQMESLTHRVVEAMGGGRGDVEQGEQQLPSELFALYVEQLKIAEQRMAELQRQQREREDELAALRQCYEEEKIKEQDKVMTFVLKLEELHQTVLRKAAAGLETGRLLQLAERLFHDHSVRLIGVDCGLTFLMTAPMSQWISVVAKQLAIKTTLTQLLPEDVRVRVRDATSWSDVTPYCEGDLDIHLGQPLTGGSAMPSPQRAFSFKPKAADDGMEPWITSIVSTQRGTLLMTDFNNKKVKLVDLNSPHSVTASLAIDEVPRCLALLPEGLVAMTTDPNGRHKVIYILHVNRKVKVQSRIKTARDYMSITSNTDDTLIVSCLRDSDGPPSVDVITRHGHVIRTIANNGSTLPDRPVAYYMHSVGNRVYISDWHSQKVFVVHVDTGRLLDTLTHPDLKGPRQVCLDNVGNLYVASEDGRCVLVRSPRGQWCRLLEADRHSEEGFKAPFCVVFVEGLVVVVWYGYGAGSLLTGYELKWSEIRPLPQTFI